MALLPNVSFNINTNANAINNTDMQNKKLGLVPKFDFEENKFVVEDGKIVYCTETQAVEQWIYFILQTYKNKYVVYKSTEFNCNIEDLIGKKPVGFVLAQLKNEIETAVLKHRYVSRIENFNTTYYKNKLEVEFTAILKDNSILEIKV